VDDYLDASGSPNISALAGYIKLAMADERVYNKHMAWKSRPLSSDFMHAVVERQVDAVPCQVCDAVAERWGRTIGPVITASGGDSVVLPPCIAAMLKTATSPGHGSIKRAALGATNSQGRPLFKTYVLSNKSAELSHVNQELRKASLTADLITAYDSSSMTDEDAACWAPRSPKLSIDVLSMALKHTVAAWDVFHTQAPAGLVLSDDVVLTRNFTARLSEALEEAGSGWDLIALGSCDRALPATVPTRLQPCAGTCRCKMDAVAWSYEAAKKFLATLPLRQSLELHITQARVKNGWRVLRLEPPIARTGGF
jgi:hypothetical protein